MKEEIYTFAFFILVFTLGITCGILISQPSHPAINQPIRVQLELTPKKP